MKGEEEEKSVNEGKFCEIQADLSMDFEKVKWQNTEHREICFQLESEVNICEGESLNKQEARKIMALSENHERDTDASVINGRRETLSCLRKEKWEKG